MSNEKAMTDEELAEIEARAGAAAAQWQTGAMVPLVHQDVPRLCAAMRAERERAAAERALRMAREKWAYGVDRGRLLVASHAEVIDAEEALRRAGGEP